jgi:hypothetical protein
MGIFRLLLALAVVLEHTSYNGPKLMRGWEAVHVFFIISGFYMCMVLCEKYTDNQLIKKFYLNRFLRLYPVYIITTILSISWYLLCQYTTQGKGQLASIFLATGGMTPFQNFLIWIPNFTLFGVDIVNWLNYSYAGSFSIAGPASEPLRNHECIWLGYTRWVPQAWTIGSEIWFYIAAPFILKGNRNLRLILVAGVSSLLLWQFSSPFIYEGYFIWIFWIWLFCIGMAAFLVYKTYKESLIYFLKHFKNLTRFLLIGSALFFTLPYLLSHSPPQYLILLVATFLIPFLFELTKNNKFDRFIGELSYPVYCSPLVSG